MTLSISTRQVSLHDAMVAYLRKHGDGTPPEDLAALFLKVRDPKQKFAAAAIRGILAPDSRCFIDDTGRWHAHAASGAATETTLNAQPWSALFCRTDTSGNRPLYVAIYDLYPCPSRVISGWLVDPSSLQPEDRVLLTDPAGFDAETETAASLLEKIVRRCSSRITVFLRAGDRCALLRAAGRAGFYLSDNSVLVSELGKAAGIALARPLTTAALEKAVFGTGNDGTDPAKQGERFAASVGELIQRLSLQGLETLDDLERALQRDRSHLFSGKTFTAEDLLALPACPGVYGFKDGAGAWLYIGKASNLRRRLLGYFGDTDESPLKLQRLLDESHSLVTHPYGSELESLIVEYRLIKKYAPALNSKTDIHERSGRHTPVRDCIILLPHVNIKKGVSLWLRKGQKILLRTLSGDFSDDRGLINDLQSFFFVPTTPVSPSDFPETEIAVRWIRQKGKALTVVTVAGMADAGEVFAALRYAWREFRESRTPPAPFL
ncbi:MAG: nucleotide excision repair endonuclease [Chitinispirillaceae bacterium]|nr:nucleotide excision repair endonuclease [Chitinispirillaceae bacterium]